MDKQIIERSGYTAEIIFQPFFDDSTQKSKQYKLIIKQDDKELINRYGFTRNGAVAFFEKWLNKKNKIRQSKKFLT